MHRIVALTVLSVFTATGLAQSIIIPGAVPTVTSLSPQESQDVNSAFNHYLQTHLQDPAYQSIYAIIQSAVPTSDYAKQRSFEYSLLQKSPFTDQAKATTVVNLLSVLQQTAFPAVPTEEPWYSDLPSSVFALYESQYSSFVAGQINAGRAALTSGQAAAAATMPTVTAMPTTTMTAGASQSPARATLTSSTTGAAGHAYTMAAGRVIAGAGVIAANLLW